MNQFLKRTFIFSLLFPAFYLAGCMDTPEGFVAPQWDVNLNMPIIDTAYTLKQVVDNNPNMIKYYPKGSAMENILYYANNINIQKVTVGDNLKMDQNVTSQQASTIGTVKIQDPQPKQASISSSWTGLNPGQQFPIPAVGGIQVGVTFPQVTEFNYIALSSGSIDLTLNNVMSVPITLSNCSLLNKTVNNAVVGSLGSSVTIPANGSKTVSVPLNTGINVYSLLGFQGTLSTTGSNGSLVTVPQNSININAAFKNLAISEVQGKIIQNSINISDQFTIDNQTKFQSVVINGGTLQLTLNNGIDVDLNAIITLDGLYQTASSTSPYVINLFVPRKSSKPYSLNLSNFALKASSPTNVINYQVSVSTVASTDYRTIKSTDNVSADIQMNSLSLKSITGIVKPTTLDLKPSTDSLNLGEVKDKFRFSKISFKNPQLKLYLKPSSQFKVKINGTIKASGSNATLNFSDYISHIGNTIDSTVDIPSSDLATFLSSFAPNLPEALTISGTATVNPDNEQVTYSVSQSDSITGHAEITFPFDVGIADGEFKDTTELKLNDDAKKNTDRIQSIVLEVDITNGFPASIKYEGNFMDSLYTNLLDLPPNRPADQKFILIPAAVVDNNGKVTAPVVHKETIEIKGSDVDKFVKSRYIMHKISVNTSGATAGSATPVEFKITDSIKIRASVRLIYRVNENL